ncbi:MAG: hypothetical protein V7637_147 [Mycobacteriales bacterium]
MRSAPVSRPRSDGIRRWGRSGDLQGRSNTRPRLRCTVPFASGGSPRGRPTPLCPASHAQPLTAFAAGGREDVCRGAEPPEPPHGASWDCRLRSLLGDVSGPWGMTSWGAPFLGRSSGGRSGLGTGPAAPGRPSAGRPLGRPGRRPACQAVRLPGRGGGAGCGHPGRLGRPWDDGSPANPFSSRDEAAARAAVTPVTSVSRGTAAPPPTRSAPGTGRRHGLRSPRSPRSAAGRRLPRQPVRLRTRQRRGRWGRWGVSRRWRTWGGGVAGSRGC